MNMMRIIVFQIMILSAGYDLHNFEKRNRILRRRRYLTLGAAIWHVGELCHMAYMHYNGAYEMETTRVLQMCTSRIAGKIGTRPCLRARSPPRKFIGSRRCLQSSVAKQAMIMYGEI